MKLVYLQEASPVTHDPVSQTRISTYFLYCNFWYYSHICNFLWTL